MRLGTVASTKARSEISAQTSPQTYAHAGGRPSMLNGWHGEAAR
jgi:hypothetical protein